MKLRRLPRVPLPGPRPIPLLGPLGSMVRFFSDPVRCLRDISRRYGNIAAVSAGDASLVCAFGPELNRQVLSNPGIFRNAVEVPMPVPPGSSLERLLSFLVASNGEEHTWLRRMMMPLFQKSYLENYHADIVDIGEKHISRWRPGQTIDLATEMADIALTISFRCFFGLELSGDARRLADMSLRFNHEATALKTGLVPLDVRGTPYAKFLRFCDDYEQQLKRFIADREGKVSAKRDALSILIEARDENGNALTERQLIGAANEFFIAGHKTVATNLGWAIFMLERHPRAHSGVLEELTSTLHGEAPTMDQLGKLTTFEASLKESMRLFSPPFLFFRRPKGGVKLGDYDLPDGTSVIISPMVTHRNTDLYPDPDRFLPERWSSIQPGPYEYLPFSAGPRTCLGANFAALTLRVLLPMILQRFRFSLVPGADISYRARGPILGVKHGLPMRLHAREDRVGPPPSVRGSIHQLMALN